MVRRILAVAAALAVLMGAIAATSSMAGAVTKVDATHYTVSCSGIAGTAKFTPALTNTAGTPSNQATSITATAKGCKVTPTAGGTPVTVTGVKIAGTINSANSNHTCSGLNAKTTETGSLTITWTTTPALTNNKSVVHPNSVTGSVGGDGHAQFVLGFAAASSGPFQGTDKGVSSSSTAETVPTAVAVFSTCGSATGLKTLGIRTNANTTSPAIHAA